MPSKFMTLIHSFVTIKRGTKLVFHVGKYNTGPSNMVLMCTAKAVIRKFSQFKTEK
jgi:hypothetical protein